MIVDLPPPDGPTSAAMRPSGNAATGPLHRLVLLVGESDSLETDIAADGRERPRGVTLADIGGEVDDGEHRRRGEAFLQRRIEIGEGS